MRAVHSSFAFAGFVAFLLAAPGARAQVADIAAGAGPASSPSAAPTEASPSAARAETPPSTTPPEAAAALPAPATPQEAAAIAYAEGETHFRLGRYAEAEAAFIRAYGAVPNPTTLLAIAESRALQGFGPEAVDVYERYLVAAPDAPDRAAVQQRIEELRASPGVLRVVTVPEGARVFVDDVPSEHPTPTDVSVAPGSHRIRVELEGYEPMEGTVDVRFASTRPVNATLEALPEPPPPEPVEPPAPPERVERRMTKPVWITAAATGGLAVTGAVLGFTAMKAQSEFDHHPTEATATRGERLALAADLSFGVAVATAVTSIVLYFRQDTDAPSSRVTLAPVVTPTSAAVQAGLRF